METNRLQEKFDDFSTASGVKSWDWYNDIYKYTNAIHQLREVELNDFKSYEELNNAYRTIVNDYTDDFLDRYLFSSKNGLSTIRNQLISKVRREELRHNLRNDPSPLIKTILSEDVKTGYQNLQSFIKENRFAVYFRFLRTLFPDQFTTVDSDHKLKQLLRILKEEFNINLAHVHRFDIGKELLNLIEGDDLVVKQIFFWELLAEYDSSRETVSKVKVDPEYYVNLKHALSTEENDSILAKKGYFKQGLIGFIYSKKMENSIPLTQVLIESSSDYFYYLHRETETFTDNDINEEKVIGFVTLNSNGDNLKLERYKRNKILDHFYCTNPNEDKLSELNYRIEDKNGFESSFILEREVENSTALYVYSNNPNIKLFSSPTFVKSSTEEVQNLIVSKLNSDSKFWWLSNYRQDWQGPPNREVGEVYNFGVRKGLIAVPPVGTLAIVPNLDKPYIEGVFEVTNIDKTSIEAIYRYEFQKKTKIEEFEQLPTLNNSNFFDILRSGCFQISREVFQEIINTTEIGSTSVPASPSEFETEYSKEQQSTTLDGDSDFSSKDLLEIENDVRSFALLLASNNVKPPLAIALFGKWGSGKSFFMKLLQKRIADLSLHQGFLIEPDDESTERRKETDKELFCKGIAQIEFNAWSYLDANLWAGLVTSIFEKLNEYISETTKSGVAKMKVQEELKKRLKTLQTKKLTEEERREELHNLKKGYEIEGKKLKDSIVSNFSNKILSFIDADDDLKTAHSRISKDGYLAELSTQLNLSKLEEEAATFKSFFRNLKKVKPLLKYVIPAGVGVLIAIWVQSLNIEFDITWGALVPFLGSIGIDLRMLRKRYNKVKSYVKGFNDLIDSNNALQEQVVNHRLLAENAREQIEQANDQIEELDKDIDNFKSYMEHEIHQEAIRDFIQTRAEHSDYKDKLGIVSIIRRDFETLSELFYNGSDEDDNASTIDASEKQLIREQFQKGKRLERIILYIDDLDRCSDEKVLEVIQAVHLLMAFPLFNVVVGVDKRCVRNALLLKTKLEYRKIAELDEIKRIGVDMISPGEYLEKIFQIPFELKDPAKEDIQGLADYLLKDQVQKETPKPKIEEPDISDDALDESPSDIRFQKTLPDSAPDEAPLMSLVTDESELGSSQAAGSGAIQKEDVKELMTSKHENLELSQLEVDQIKEILFFVGNTPRTAKRYINIYRIIRAHKRPDSDKELTNEDHLAIMFLLAIGIGDHKRFAFELMQQMRENQGTLLNTVVKKVEGKKENEDDLKKFKSAFDKLKDEPNLEPLLKLKGKDFEVHIPFVRRFSFGKEEENTGSEHETAPA